MSVSAEERRADLRARYGFDFPADLFQFWDFAKRLRPLEPQRAFEDTLGIALVGPFDVLAGRFDGRHIPHSTLLHWRYYPDPPEFFTALAGATEGLHWGWYLDDPSKSEGCIAYYYAHDAFDLSVGGDSLFDAVRLEIEYRHADCLDSLADNDEAPAAIETYLGQLDHLRIALREQWDGERAEVGVAYTDKYQGMARRNERVVAATQEGMGIVAPAEHYRPLSLRDRKLWHYLWQDDDPIELVEEARAALQAGYVGTALKLGKELWAVDGGQRNYYASQLLHAAYTQLERWPLLNVLETHLSNRDLASVDLLDLA